MASMVVTFPLRVKLQLATVVAVVIFGAVNAFIVVRLTYRQLWEEQNRRVAFSGRLLAQRLVEPLLFADLVAAQRLLEESLELDSSFLSIRVVGSDGRQVVGCQRPSPTPQGPEASTVAGFAIMNGRLGRVDVEVWQEPLRQQVDHALRTVIGMVLGILLAGMATAVGLARSVTRPVEQLVAFARQFHPDRPDPPLPEKRNDELGLLAREFAAMARRLRELHQESLRHARELARLEHLATVGTLAAGVAHEINNPLAGIRSGLQRLRRRVPNDPHVGLYFDTFTDALTRIEKAVQGLLNFARATEVTVEPIPLAPVVTEAAELARPRLLKAGVAFLAHIPQDLPWVQGDRARLREVFLNLFLNACDAMEGGGELKVVAEQHGNRVRIRVQDTGPGVPAELQEKIFLPFFTTKRDKGTGLGLAMARAAMREMGGDLRLVPTPAGACFELWLEQS